MKNILRILFLLVLLAAAGLWAFYHTHRQAIHDNLRIRIETELSLITNRDVSVGKVKYSIFGEVRLEDVSVADPEENKIPAAEADAITLSIDLPSLFKEKQLTALITVEGCRSGDILCDTTFRVYSRKSDSLRTVFDPELVSSIFVIDGVIRSSGAVVRDITGTIAAENSIFAGAKVKFRYKNADYLSIVKPIVDEDKRYYFELRSSGLELKAHLTGDVNAVTIDSLEGIYHTVAFGMKGDIQHPLMTDMSGAVSASFEIDLASLSSLPGKAGETARRHDIEGPVSSKVKVTLAGTDVSAWDISADVSGEDLVIDKLYLQKISSSLSIEKGRLSTRSITGALYNGALTADFKVDLLADGFPFILTLDLKDLNFGRMMLDISEDNSGVFGDLNMDLQLKGYLDNDSTLEGSGSVTVSDGDLGEMPLLTPLLGNIYMRLQGIFAPEAQTGEITAAYADFEIKQREFITDNLTFIGDDIAISSQGSVDFDGNLDFVFENSLIEKSEEESYNEDWQVTLRNAIVNAGNFISKSKLRGTLSDPEWGL